MALRQGTDFRRPKRSLLRLPKSPRNNQPNNKIDLADFVRTSSNNYAILKSKTKRFSDVPPNKDRHLLHIGDALYDTESKGPAGSMTAAVQSSLRSYAPVFRSRAPRFSKLEKQYDPLYDIDQGRPPLH